MPSRFTKTTRQGRAGIGKIVFAVILIVTIVISSTVTYALINFTDRSTPKDKEGSSNLSSLANIFPISAANASSINETTTSCYTGNWSAIYSQYETPLNNQQNSSLGEQYLNDPQFISFLSQYLNMSNPQVNATVVELLSGNESMFVQQQVQSQGLAC